jgi:uncharacterized caspase-like protein
MPAFPNGHALVIGVDTYVDARWNVPIAAADAAALHAALIDPQRGGYLPGQVDLLTGAQATRQGIGAALKNLADRIGPADTALISFTGHGAPGSDGLYYLGAHDMRFDGQQIEANSALSVADLGRAIRRIGSERVVVLLNACFSGAAAPALAQGGIAPERIGTVLPDAQGNQLLKEATDPNSGAGRAIITASRPGQLSRFDKERAHSFFSQALLDALKGGDGAWAHQRFLGLFELYTFLHKRVPQLVQNAQGATQEPLLTLLQGAGNFAVAAAQGGAAAPTEPLMAALPSDLPVRNVGRDLIVAQPGSTVNIDNRQEAPLISFGANSSIGDVKIGDVARGDIIKTYDPGSPPPAGEDETIDPAKLLPRLAREIRQARNVDEDAQADAADRINSAATALADGKRDRALRLIGEALTFLAPLRANGYVNSRARKLEQVRDALEG